MAFRVEFAADAERDFGLIFDHLVHSYLDVGESPQSALDRAESRIGEIRAAARRIATAPRRGERHDDLLAGLRLLAIGRAIHWFGVDDEQETVRLLAVFFGGQDHVRHMLVRLLGE